MTTALSTTTIGDLTIETSEDLIDVGPIDESVDGWIAAPVTVGYYLDRSGTPGVRHKATVTVGVYTDGTLDDHDSWCAAMDAERAIAAMIGAGNYRVVLPSECDALGAILCGALLADHRRNVE